MATLKEVDTYWDLVELLDAHEALDIKEEAEYRANKALEGN